MFEVHGFQQVKASVSGYGQAPEKMSVARFEERAIEKHGLFLLTRPPSTTMVRARRAAAWFIGARLLYCR